MDHVEVPKEQIQPMDAIAAGIQGLRIVFVNVFAVKHPGGWTLIDAGLPFSAGYIRSWAEKEFNGPPNAIVLTHGHFDHVSAAADLANQWDVPIYAHFLEHEYLNGSKEYPPPNASAGGGLMTLLSPLLPRGPVNLGSRLRQLNASAGVDIYKSERVTTQLQVDGQNLTNVLDVIDFNGLFSGNAIGPSRSYQLRLTTNF